VKPKFVHDLARLNFYYTAVHCLSTDQYCCVTFKFLITSHLDTSFSYMTGLLLVSTYAQLQIAKI